MSLELITKPATCAAIHLFAAAALMGALMAPAAALVEIDITRGNVEPLPIAIPNFAGAGQDQQLGIDIAGVVTADLKGSGLFQPLDPATFTQPNIGPGDTPRFADWKVLSAQALVAGGIARQPDGRLRAEFRLWDVFAGQQMAGQQFFTSPDNWRRVAHIIADAIYQRLTGEKGYFDSRIVFVDEAGPAEKVARSLAIMDQDGANFRYLTHGSYEEYDISPSFSPSSQEIAYMHYPPEFSGKQPSGYLLNIDGDTGQRVAVGDPDRTTSYAPRFAPDGQKVVISVQRGPNANVFTVDLRSRVSTQLTNDPASDTNASYSSDGKQIVFESDRGGGGTQLYVMNADGSNPHRITFGVGSYDTPAWSPRGDLIAFTRRNAGLFAIGVIKPDGSGERILTEGFDNEGPTWAPNGRVIMFSRKTPGSNGGPQLWTIGLTGYGEARVPTPNFASDPVWSPLLN